MWAKSALRHLQGLIDPHEVVPDGVQGDHVAVVLELLATGVGQARVAAHVQPHRELGAGSEPALQVSHEGHRVLGAAAADQA